MITLSSKSFSDTKMVGKDLNPHSDRSMDEDLADHLYHCFTNVIGLEDNVGHVHRACLNIFDGSSTVNEAALPSPALFEGLLALCSVPSVRDRIAHCLLLLAASTPTAWRMFTATTVFTRPEVSHAILDAYLASPKSTPIPEAEAVSPLTMKLHNFSDVNFWEQRAFLVTLPKTPFSFAVQTALADVAVMLQRPALSIKENPNICIAQAPLHRLQGLVSNSADSEWEAVSDSCVLHVLELLCPEPLDTVPSSLAQRVTLILPNSPYYKYSIRYRGGEEQMIHTEKNVSTLHDQDAVCSLDFKDVGSGDSRVQHAVVDLLCSLPELEECLNHQPCTTNESTGLEELLKGNEDVISSNLETISAGVITIVTGLTNPTTRYERTALSALEAFLDTISKCRTRCKLEERLVEKTLDFVLAENRQVNGVPRLFVNIVNPLFQIVASSTSVRLRGNVANRVRGMVNNRGTCAELKVAAQWMLREICIPGDQHL